MKFENTSMYAMIRKLDDTIAIVENPQDVSGIFYVGLTNRAISVYCSSMQQLVDCDLWFKSKGIEIV